MPGLFWDTSALVKHYHPELGTLQVDDLLQKPGSQHAISRLAVTETFSVFAGKVRAGLITLVEFDHLCRRFLADTKGKLFSVARLLVAHHREAEEVSCVDCSVDRCTAATLYSSYLLQIRFLPRQHFLHLWGRNGCSFDEDPCHPLV